MYAEPTMRDLKNLQHNNQLDKQRFLTMYPYLSHSEEMTQQQNEQEGIRIINLIRNSILENNPKTKLIELLPEEITEKGTKIVKLTKAIYQVLQYEDNTLQETIQPMEQLQQAIKNQNLASKQLQQTNEQLLQFNEQLQHAKKQFQPMKAQCEVIHEQINHLGDELNTLIKSLF